MPTLPAGATFTVNAVAFSLLLFLETPGVEAAFLQVHPEPKAEKPRELRRSKDRERAVVLLHGLKLHPFSAENAARAVLHRWQRPGSAMVKALGAESDVFSFAYAQTTSVDELAAHGVLGESVKKIKALGYGEIVLIGHSAGGLIARQFVEDNPALGVTKVIQICAPNTGCGCARFDWYVRANQRPFVRSLGKEARAEQLRRRKEKRVPEKAELLCVIADVTGLGDWVVADHAQWPADLRAQGIPAVQVAASHATIWTSRAARTLAPLVRQASPRWTVDEVAMAEEKFLSRPSLRPVADCFRTFTGFFHRKPVPVAQPGAP